MRRLTSLWFLRQTGASYVGSYSLETRSERAAVPGGTGQGKLTRLMAAFAFSRCAGKLFQEEL